jgi:hypothetical protein
LQRFQNTPPLQNNTIVRKAHNFNSKDHELR